MNLNQAIKTSAVVLRNIILGANVVSLSLIKSPRRMVEYISESLFLYKTLNNKRGLPQRTVFDAFVPEADVESIKLSNLKSGGTWFCTTPSYLADIVSLCLICKIIKPHTVFEIGTFKGYTTYHLALNTPENTRIYTLDLPKEKNIQTKLETSAMDDFHIQGYESLSGQYWFEGSPEAAKITPLFGDSATFDFSPYSESIDLFFIDGAHSYEYCQSDTLNAVRCCHPGSVIVWHDFGRVGVAGVTRWLLEFSRERQLYSIPGGSLVYAIIK
jgi:hypothetical protein